MQNPSSTLVDLETKFWQSMVDQNTDVALHGWRCAMHTETPINAR